jgi:hypothetical protein
LKREEKRMKNKLGSPSLAQELLCFKVYKSRRLEGAMHSLKEQSGVFLGRSSPSMQNRGGDVKKKVGSPVGLW